MTRRRVRALGCAALLTCGLVPLTAAGHTSSPQTSAPASGFRADAAFRILPLSAGGPRGVAYLHQRGSRLTGWVAVWGLPPKTAHAAHVHGPSAACRPATRRTKNHVAELPVLRADANGVAFARLNVRVHAVAVARGRYLMVHQDPPMPMTGGTMPMNPGIACGNLAVIARGM